MPTSAEGVSAEEYLVFTIEIVSFRCIWGLDLLVVIPGYQAHPFNPRCLTDVLDSVNIKMNLSLNVELEEAWESPPTIA